MPEHGPARAPRTPLRWHRLAVALFVALVAVPLIAVTIISNVEFEPVPGFLEIDMKATGGTNAQLFWTSTWAFSQEESVVLPLHTQPGEFERLRFPLPNRRLEFVRFDPLDGPGEVFIRSIRVTDTSGRTLRTVPPLAISPLYQIAAITPESGGVRVTITPPGNDPMLLMRAHWLLPMPGWHSWQFVVPATLAVIVVAVLGLIGVSTALVGREIAAGSFAGRHALWLGALFVTVVAAKLSLLQHYPVPVPYWDQWDGEASGLYYPFAHGALTWRQMFTLHNEHRIFFTRVLAMALVWIDGQWDPHLQIVANILIHALTATLTAAILWLAAGRRWLPWIAMTVALTVAPPFALENTLAGFQSAFYFLALFSVLAIWLMGMRRPGSPGWFVGWLCAFAAIFTVAGGLLTVAAIAIVVALRTVAEPGQWRQAVVNACALALVTGVAYLAMAPHLPQHDFLFADSVHSFLLALARNLAFPWVLRPRASVVLWLPLIAVTVRILLRRLGSGPFEWIVLAIGGWAALQCAAVAYSRGAHGAIPASRYLDTLGFGFLANTMALVGLVSGWRRFRWSPAVGWTTLIVWLVVGAMGIASVSERVLQSDGADRRQFMRTYVRNIRQLIVGDNPAALLKKTGPQEIPYFDAAMLTAWLRESYLSGILPSTLRRPLTLTAKAGTVSTFDRPDVAMDPTPVWDSYAKRGDSGTGRFESEPVQCAAFAHLRFEISGSPGRSGLRLALHALPSGPDTLVESTQQGGRAWRSVIVPCPDGPFSVVAEDSSPTASFGFRAPSEIAWASALAEALISWWAAFVVSAAALALLALAATVRTPNEGAAVPMSGSPGLDPVTSRAAGR